MSGEIGFFGFRERSGEIAECSRSKMDAPALTRLRRSLPRQAMTDEPPESLIPYDEIVQEALRAVVGRVLHEVEQGGGLPGGHHFYITFLTKMPGVQIPKHLVERFPDEMTIVIQHRFWDLIVSDDRFEVNLTFDSIPERLVVPFSAIKVFFDPSVPYGLQFDEAEAEEAAPQQVAAPRSAGQRVAPREASMDSAKVEPARAEKKSRAPRRPQAEKAAERGAGGDKPPAKPLPLAKPAEPGPGNGPKVVSIDAFRKK